MSDLTPLAFPFQGAEPGEAAQAARGSYERGVILTGEAARCLEEGLAWSYCNQNRHYPTSFFSDALDTFDGCLIAKLYVDAWVDRLKIAIALVPCADKNVFEITDGVEVVEFTSPPEDGPDLYILSGTLILDAPGEVELTLNITTAGATFPSLRSLSIKAVNLRSFP